MKTTYRLRVAADIGGTFTDVAAFDERQGRLLLGKTLTTPDKLVQGILHGMDKAGVALPEAHLFLHGSTVAINTMLERSGARTALITTRGVSRHLRNWPHQPARLVQPAAPQTRTLGRARSAL